MMTDNASAIGIGALLALLLTVCILPLAGFEVTTESLLFLGTVLRQVREENPASIVIGKVLL
jgi:hypothetical protein